MAKKVIVDKQVGWNWQDLLKGGILAAISPVFTILIQSLQAEEFAVNWKSIFNVAIISFLTYMSKNLNLFGKASVTTFYDSNEKATEVAKEIKK